MTKKANLSNKNENNRAQVFFRLESRWGTDSSWKSFYFYFFSNWTNLEKWNEIYSCVCVLCVFWERLLAFFGDVPRWWGWWCNLQTLDKNTCVWKEHGMEKAQTVFLCCVISRLISYYVLVSDWGVELFYSFFATLAWISKSLNGFTFTEWAPKRLGEFFLLFLFFCVGRIFGFGIQTFCFVLLFLLYKRQWNFFALELWPTLCLVVAPHFLLSISRKEKEMNQAVSQEAKE